MGSAAPAGEVYERVLESWLRQRSGGTGRNPLVTERAGVLWVRCPRCGAEGEGWAWELRRAPVHAAYTVPAYRCRGTGCGHIFALAPPAA